MIPCVKKKALMHKLEKKLLRLRYFLSTLKPLNNENCFVSFINGKILYKCHKTFAELWATDQKGINFCTFPS